MKAMVPFLLCITGSALVCLQDRLRFIIFNSNVHENGHLCSLMMAIIIARARCWVVDFLLLYIVMFLEELDIAAIFKILALYIQSRSNEQFQSCQSIAYHFALLLSHRYSRYTTILRK